MRPAGVRGRTPLRQDKRLQLVAATVAALFVFVWFGRVPAEIGVPSLVGLVGGYIAQSQWGQTRRATKEGGEDAGAAG